VLVGDDAGSRSTLRLLDVGRRCWSVVGSEADVIRSALLSPDGAVVWEHRVDRTTRADLGLWSRPADGNAAAARVLPGLAPDATHGRTWTTELTVAADGRIVVASCGERACRTRVLDSRSGGVLSASATGPAVGVTGSTLVVLDPCTALPCRVAGIDLRTSVRSALGATWGPAALGGSDGSTLVLTAADGALEILPATGARTTTRRVAAGEGVMPLRSGSTATSGLEVDRGSVPFARDGRVSDPSGAGALDPASLAVTRLSEVQP